MADITIDSLFDNWDQLTDSKILKNNCNDYKKEEKKKLKLKFKEYKTKEKYSIKKLEELKEQIKRAKETHTEKEFIEEQINNLKPEDIHPKDLEQKFNELNKKSGVSKEIIEYDDFLVKKRYIALVKANSQNYDLDEYDTIVITNNNIDKNNEDYKNLAQIYDERAIELECEEECCNDDLEENA